MIDDDRYFLRVDPSKLLPKTVVITQGEINHSPIESESFEDETEDEYVV